MTKRSAIFTLILVLGVSLTVSQAQNVTGQNCTNPLLQRSEVLARFGGAANVLNASATSNATTSDPCAYLTGQQVCVSDAGSAAFKTWLTTYKSSFVSRGSLRTVARFWGLYTKSLATPVQKCKAVSLSLKGFLQQVANTTNTTIDFTSWIPTIQSAINTTFTDKTSVAGKDVKALLTVMILEKSNCTRQAFKHVIQTTCAAMTSNYSNFLSGTSDAPTLKIKHATCDTFKSNCMNYYAATKRAEELLLLYAQCNQTDAQTIYNTLMNSTLNVTQQNTALNTVVSKSSTINITSTNSYNSTTYKGLTCDSDATTASDCDFLCASAINATHVLETAFENLDSSSTSRLLQQTSIQYDATFGLAADVNINDNVSSAAIESAPADVGTISANSTSNSTSNSTNNQTLSTGNTGKNALVRAAQTFAMIIAVSLLGMVTF